jgi:type I restriction enzyme S subunit
MLPKGWEVKHLSEIADINPRKSSCPKDNLVSFVPMDAVSEAAQLIRTEVRFYSEVEKGFTSFCDKDVLLAKITPCFENGKGAHVTGLVNGIGFGSTEFHVLRAKKKICAEFLYYVTNTKEFRVRGEANMQGSAGQKRVPTDYLKEYKVFTPQLPEQIKIAEILSTWDNAINTMQKLLANSQQQKKSLMQQLLTGKKRFVWFEGEWEKVKLKSLGRCLTGLTYSPDDVVENGILVLRSSNIQSGKLSFADNVYVNKVIEEKNKTRYGDILVCIRNGSRNLIGKTAFIKEEGCGQTHGAFMTLFRGNHSEYVFQLFQSHTYYKQVSQNLGATINSINTSDLHEFVFFMPSNKSEIEKIAAVLTTADQEIDNLRAQINHLKQEKKALMQQLLTGKRRVKVEEAA